MSLVLRKQIPSFFFSLVLLVGGAAKAEEIGGVVTHVRDGDTIEIGSHAIRLNGLHAGELGTDLGDQAAVFMRDLVLGEKLVCQLNGERSYDRVVGICRLNGKDIAVSLIEAGLGRDCPRYSKGRYAGIDRLPSKTLPLPPYCR